MSEGTNLTKMPLDVRSHYYKGLLVLSRRDRSVDPEERALLVQIGQVLGFDRRFCEVTIDELLSNPHISRSPVVFQDDAVKGCFFRDAVRLACTDGSIHPMELSWLRRTARANGKSYEWLNGLIFEYAEREKTPPSSRPFEIQNLTL